MNIKTVLSSVFLMMLSVSGCTEDNIGTTEDDGAHQEDIRLSNRSRLAWDKASLIKIFSSGNYARVIELEQDKLIAVSGSPSGIQLSLSNDRGKTWSDARVVAPNRKGVSMAVPEIMKCKNGNLLLTYNPRPVNNNNDQNLKFGIRARISKDNGLTWSDEIFVYDSSYKFSDGCWEPFTLQMPSGEIRLFFANEFDYQSTNEQNISMCRSFDNGQTWSEREIVSFRPGFRDGMPAAIHLEYNNQIIISIEDNGYQNHRNRMQPTIIRIDDQSDNSTVLAEDSRREYALNEHLPSVDNAAAPYICQAVSGEILLSYQGTQGRNVPLDENGLKSIKGTQEMFVLVGDSLGRNFTNATAPFNLPLGPTAYHNKGIEGMWNSIASFSTGEVFAVTSTNAYNFPKVEVYGMKGYVLSDISPKVRKVKIDAILDECLGDTPDFVVAHELESSLYGYVYKTQKGLYLGFTISGNDYIKHSGTNELNDGLEILFASADGKRNKSISIPIDGDVKMDRKEEMPDGIIYKKATALNNNFVFECILPYSYLKPLQTEDKIHMNVVSYDSQSNGKIVSESIVLTSPKNVTTWQTVSLK